MAKTQKEISPEVEQKVVDLITNEPGVIEVDGWKLWLKRPAMKDKYRGKVWSDRRLKDLDITQNEQPELEFYYSYYGSVGVNVVRAKNPENEEIIFTEDDKPQYWCLFDKVVNYIYDAGGQEEAFVMKAIEKYAQWVEDTSVSEEDIKNS